MNEAPNQQTGLNDTFSSQPSPQSNPFTADLKGEFTSNFGTNTNAVSQIFKEGGFVGGNRSKIYIAIGVVVALVAGAFFYFTGEESPSSGDEVAESTEKDSADEAAEEDGEKKTDTAATKPEEKPTVDEKAEPEAEETAAAKPAVKVEKATKSGFTGGSGKIALSEPADGSSLNYDETQGAANFSWSGGSGYIVFSRNQSMRPAAMRMPVSGNSYSFLHPWPGTWYWRIENSTGNTEVRSFKVSPPARRNIQLQQPQQGAQVAGNGGTVSWQGDSKVAYYRVELANGSWTNPQYKFASSGNSLQLQGVPAGQYQLRLGAFSEVAGRMEYTAPITVTVQ